MTLEPIAVRLALVRESDVPVGDDWLGDRERALQRGLRHDKRRRDWRRGRWAAKQALATCWPEREHADIEVLPDELGAPRVHLDDRLRPTPISISHRQDLALCALGAGSSAPGHRLGCDLEHVEERSEAFVSDFFCASEQARCFAADAAERPVLANLIWSAKESALKLLGTGLRRDTRSVEVVRIEGAGYGWCALTVRDHQTGTGLRGWWRRAGDTLMTVLASSPMEVPEGEILGDAIDDSAVRDLPLWTASRAAASTR